MKIAILYFSGSGNTELIVRKRKEEATSLNNDVDLFRIENNPEINYENYDKVCFAYPIHAFNAPKIVLRFAKSIKKQTKKIDYFVIMVSGEYLKLNNSSSSKLNSLLKHRNFKLISEYHYLMPYNMIFRHADEMAFKMKEAIDVLLPNDVRNILNNKNNKLSKLPLIRPLIWAFRIEQIFAPINGKTFKIDNEKCIKCMKCVNACPVHNIDFKDDKFIFHNKCLMCTRCSFNCPKDAFNIGLLNGWRVNGRYSFINNNDLESNKHKNYCKNSYKKYFESVKVILEEK